MIPRLYKIGRARHIVAFTLLLCLAAGCVRTVERGRFYRSGQMQPAMLAHAIDSRGIRTVINLRGSSPDETWYVREVETCARMGVTHHDLDWTKRRIPEPESLARFVELVETSDPPMLIHCQGGVHRSGVASAMYLLVRGRSVEEARKQLGLFFNDAPIGAVLDMFEGSPLPFAEWVGTVYPGLYEAANP